MIQITQVLFFVFQYQNIGHFDKMTLQCNYLYNSIYMGEGGLIFYNLRTILVLTLNFNLTTTYWSCIYVNKRAIRTIHELNQEGLSYMFPALEKYVSSCNSK